MEVFLEEEVLELALGGEGALFCEGVEWHAWCVGACVGVGGHEKEEWLARRQKSQYWESRGAVVCCWLVQS